MILWNRNREVTKRLTSDDHRDIAEEICTKDLVTAMEIIDIAINVLTPLALLWVLKLNSISFNLLTFAIAFCVFDIVMCIVDHLVIVVIPRNKTLSISFTKAQERLDKMKEKKNQLDENYKKFRKDHKCDNCWHNCSSCYEYQKLKNQINILKTFIDEEEIYINSELDKIKEEEIRTDKRKSEDYENKRDFLKRTKEKLEYFVKTYKVHEVDIVITSIAKLDEVLEKKPMGQGLIDGTLYLYLDELQKILSEYVSLNDKQRNAYLADIKKLSMAFGQNLDRLTERIEKLETESMEVSIAVLMNELTGSGGEEDV